MKEKYTVGQIWNLYCELKHDLKSLKNDIYRFNKHLKVLSDEYPENIDQFMIERLKAELSKEYAPATVHHILEILRRILNFAKKMNIIDEIKVHFEMPLLDNEVTEYLTLSERRRLFAVIGMLRPNENYWHYQAGQMMKLALFSGMRKGEMVRLKWVDIDFESDFIKLVNPKGGKKQFIPLNNLSKDLLSKHKDHAQESKYVFSGRNGEQLKAVAKSLRYIKYLAELPKDYRPLHGHRHTYASMLANSGKVDMYTLQRLLTHKSSKMTQRYAHLNDKVLIDASNVVCEIVNS